MDYILLVVGFVILLFSANWLVDGASGLAKRMNIPDLIIGLTVVAFGTSMPEFTVNILAALKGSSEIALTNILGSNIINTMVILGVTAAIYPIAAKDCTRKYEVPMSILAGILVVLFGTDFFTNTETATVSRIDGAILLIFFALFMFYTLKMAKKGHAEIDENYRPMKYWKAILLIVVGLGGLVLGGKLIVDNAIAIARAWNVPEAIIGVTIVALGTSLPELATSAIAATKKNADIAIGNVVGSNIFNIFLVLGASSVIRPLTIYKSFVVDSITVIFSGLLIYIFVNEKQHAIKRRHGILLLLFYAIYLGYLIMQII